MTPEKDQFVQYLHAQGMRVTGERLALFDEIYRQHGHIDAEALLAGARARGHRLSRATAYRTLDLLVRCGLVRRQRLGVRGHLYEHVHPGQGHDHLVCGDCGRVVEFVSRAIAALQAEICRAHGFSPEHHQLQITGLCEACRAGREAGQVEAAPETVS